MGSRPEDLTGQRFGRRIVLKQIGRASNGSVIWLCHCDCGTESGSKASLLKNGTALSCGCANREAITKHGARRNGITQAEYTIWANMIKRCRNPNNKAFDRYGGRGITVCARWLDFANFLADMGNRPSDHHSIERIKNGGGYEPENCRWATPREQARNKRKYKNNASGITGVYKKGAKWAAEIGDVYLGSFKRKENAQRARERAQAASDYNPEHGA